MDLIHETQNATVPYPTKLHVEQKCAHSVLNGALWDMEHVHSWICEIGLFWLKQVKNNM